MIVVASDSSLLDTWMVWPPEVWASSLYSWDSLDDIRLVWPLLSLRERNENVNEPVSMKFTLKKKSLLDEMSLLFIVRNILHDQYWKVPTTVLVRSISAITASFK